MSKKTGVGGGTMKSDHVPLAGGGTCGAPSVQPDDVTRSDPSARHGGGFMKPLIVFLAFAFASVALLASAVTLSEYESARSDPAKQSQIFHEAYSTSVSKIVTQLRSSTFADGKVKTPQRLENDRKLADVVDEIAAHPTDAQSQALIVMIEKYAAAQPDTKLEDVISSFLLTEAKKQLGKHPPKEKTK